MTQIMGSLGYSEEAYIGVDLDGTLAHTTNPFNLFEIGAPIPKMVARVKRLMANCYSVRIITARLGGLDEPLRSRVRKSIQDWCETYIGSRLEVSSEKTFGMIVLYDDRTIRVECDTGDLCSECNTGDEL